MVDGEGIEPSSPVYQTDVLTVELSVKADARSSSLSLKQWALVKKIAIESTERAARIEEDNKNAKPIPAELLEGRNTFKGEIVCTKEQESMYGITLKMLVKDERGFKVWGTAPNALWNDHDGSVKGMIVQFDAALEVSEKDETFGFYKRPTKVSVISTPEGENA